MRKSLSKWLTKLKISKISTGLGNTRLVMPMNGNNLIALTAYNLNSATKHWK